MQEISHYSGYLNDYDSEVFGGELHGTHIISCSPQLQRVASQTQSRIQQQKPPCNPMIPQTLNPKPNRLVLGSSWGIKCSDPSSFLGSLERHAARTQSLVLPLQLKSLLRCWAHFFLLFLESLKTNLEYFKIQLLNLSRVQ